MLPDDELDALRDEPIAWPICAIGTEAQTSESKPWWTQPYGGRDARRDAMHAVWRQNTFQINPASIHALSGHALSP